MWKELITGAFCASAGLLLRSEYEKKNFVTERFCITSPKIWERERNLVFLTDLHNQEFGTENKELRSAIDRIQPDLVLIGGDMMVCKGKRELEPALTFVERLAQRYPVYYANGNHEDRMNREREVYGDLYDRFQARLSEAGVTCLLDAGVPIGKDLQITGCTLPEPYYRHRFTVPKLPVQELRRAGEADPERFQILLLHSPLFFETCRTWGADLTLCGHFHGGTIRLPLLGGVMTPQYQFFLPWCAGRFDAEGKTMLVSRGLGTHSINLRLNNRPQLVWVTLSPSKEKTVPETGETGGNILQRKRKYGNFL